MSFEGEDAKAETGQQTNDGIADMRIFVRRITAYKDHRSREIYYAMMRDYDDVLNPFP